VTDKRNMEGGKAGVTAEGAKAGDTYTVTFTRKLAGGVNLAAGQGCAVRRCHPCGQRWRSFPSRFLRSHPGLWVPMVT
jgi:superfamily I DNA/RNA helicase